MRWVFIWESKTRSPAQRDWGLCQERFIDRLSVFPTRFQESVLLLYELVTQVVGVSMVPWAFSALKIPASFIDIA